MIKIALDREYDLISNVFSRKFPKGQSVEILKSALFRSVKSDQLSDQEKEHVVPYFYKTRERYKCLFLALPKDLSHINQCVDTIEELKEIGAKWDKYIFDESELCIMKF
jgi:spore coat polysaccharide biosynthesis protein SpsF